MCCASLGLTASVPAIVEALRPHKVSSTLPEKPRCIDDVESPPGEEVGDYRKTESSCFDILAKSNSR